MKAIEVFHRPPLQVSSYESVEAFEKDWPEANLIDHVSRVGHDDGVSYHYYSVGNGDILELYSSSSPYGDSQGYELDFVTAEHMNHVLTTFKGENDD